MSIKRSATLVFLLAAVGMLLAGALFLPWWEGSLESGSFEIDLRGMRMCLDGVCGDAKALSVADASAVPWAKIGTSVYAASLVASLLLVGCIWRTVRGQPKSTLQWIAGVMAFFAGVLALVFVFTRPEFGQWTPGYGLASTLAGALVGTTSASASARVALTETRSP